MLILAIIGILAVTGLLVYITLGNLGVFVYSDENFRNTIAWNWKDLWFWWVVNLVVFAGWLFLILHSGIHVSIS